MSEMGQSRKAQREAHVFCFAPDNGHCAAQSACPFVPILLQKSKIERRRKSRESRCLDVSTAAMLARPDTKVRRRFCVKRCGPSRRRVRTASAVLKILFISQKRLFQQYLPIGDIPSYSIASPACATSRTRREVIYAKNLPRNSPASCLRGIADDLRQRMR